MPDIEVRNIKENVPPKNYNGIDIVKFLCAILVFAIHIPPIGTSIGGTLSTTNTQLNFILQSCVCRIAVPFFFVCSGFFLFQKMEPNIIDINRIKNYCFKMLRLLGIWSVLLFWGGTGHLWYLGATVVAIAFLSILLHYNVDIKWLIVFAVALYALGLLGDSYFGFIKPFIGEGGFKYVYAAYDFIVGKSRNGFMMGYIFVLLGYLFAQGKFRIKAPISLIGLLISLVLLILEALVLNHYNIPLDYNMYISLLPSVFFLFSFVSSLSLLNRPIYAKLRTASMLIYFLHMFINVGVGILKKALYKFLNVDIQMFQFFISLTATLIVAFIIEYASRKEKFKWLRWLIT